MDLTRQGFDLPPDVERHRLHGAIRDLATDFEGEAGALTCAPCIALESSRIERACAQLHHDGQQVTFTAAATGLGRTTLYRDPTLRAVIDQRRHCAATSGTLTGLTDEIATLRTALETIATRVAATTNNSDASPARKTDSVNRPNTRKQDY